MLGMMQRRGQRRAQRSTLRHTTPSTIALHPSTITILLASSSLVSPSFFLPPSLPFPLLPDVFLAQNDSSARLHTVAQPESDDSPPPTTPLLFHKFNLRQKLYCNEDMRLHNADVWIRDRSPAHLQLPDRATSHNTEMHNEENMQKV